jgi:hypothetical protein
MPKLSPRDAVKVYQASRATLMKALSNGTISAEKTDAGHWQIDPAELARVYLPRAPQKAVGRASPGQVNRNEPGQMPLIWPPALPAQRPPSMPSAKRWPCYSTTSMTCAGCCPRPMPSPRDGGRGDWN